MTAVKSEPAGNAGGAPEQTVPEDERTTEGRGGDTPAKEETATQKSGDTRGARRKQRAGKGTTEGGTRDRKGFSEGQSEEGTTRSETPGAGETGGTESRLSGAEMRRSGR
ncbi:hypothetical protein CSUI_011587, partial [Cystoisospora suis]